MECCVRTVFFYIFFSVQKNITHAVFKHKTISQIFFFMFSYFNRGLSTFKLAFNEKSGFKKRENLVS